jgi:gamma-glutamyl phosphate reductase
MKVEFADIKDGEIVIIDNDDEIIAWIPATFDDKHSDAIIKDGYMIVTRVIETPETPEIIRNTLRVIRGGK